MKVLVLGVTYKSYDCLLPFISSIDKAASFVPDASITVAIGDNTDSDYQDINISMDHADIHIFDYHENLGYLGCALRMMREIQHDDNCYYDYVIICNVDLKIDKYFFKELTSIDSNGIGWIAPDIYTPSHSVHENPFMTRRPTKKSFKKWKILFANPTLYGIMRRILFTKHRRKDIPANNTPIYTGHGSFMVLTRQFFNIQGYFEFPSFMYGEEIFLSELMRRLGLKVVMYSSLKVTNTGSVSISILGNKWKCRQNKRSLSILYQLFFSDDSND